MQLLKNNYHYWPLFHFCINVWVLVDYRTYEIAAKIYTAWKLQTVRAEQVSNTGINIKVLSYKCVQLKAVRR